MNQPNQINQNSIRRFYAKKQALLKVVDFSGRYLRSLKLKRAAFPQSDFTQVVSSQNLTILTCTQKINLSVNREQNLKNLEAENAVRFKINLTESRKKLINSLEAIVKQERIVKDIPLVPKINQRRKLKTISENILGKKKKTDDANLERNENESSKRVCRLGQARNHLRNGSFVVLGIPEVKSVVLGGYFSRNCDPNNSLKGDSGLKMLPAKDNRREKNWVHRFIRT